MSTEKFSVSIPESLAEFVETYKSAHHCKSRSQVIEQALLLLRERDLQEAYREASAEVDPAWDITLGDGLVDEAW